MSNSSTHWKTAKPPHSKVKSAIVTKYFVLWSSVMKKQNGKVVYLDLYAGRGTWVKGEPSTALQVLGAASKDEFLQRNLVAILNDVSTENCANMKLALSEKKYDVAFEHEPKVTTGCVDEILAEQLQSLNLAPTLCFIDPFGFKGVSLHLIQSVIKDWGCDVVLFFHTSGINRNLFSTASEADLTALYGAAGFARLLHRVRSEKTRRDKIILDEFRTALSTVGVKYFLPLQFNFRNKPNCVSHHLILLTKHPLGFRLMRDDVMQDYSVREDGMPCWKYVEGCEGAGDQLCVGTVGPMAELKEKLSTDFQGRIMLVKDLIETYDLRGELYTTKCVKAALLLLEEENRIIVDKPRSMRPVHKGRPTLGDMRTISFP